MSKMSELQLLRKLATALDLSITYKNKYDDAMKNYKRNHPFVDTRYSKKNLQKRTDIIGPLYSKYKDNKAKAEGYVFMWKQSKDQKDE